MSLKQQNSAWDRLEGIPPNGDASPERTLKKLRYVVSAVNDDARKVWGELWRELQGLSTNGTEGLPADQGFQPSCGWAEFLEKLWLLKHYLDYIHRFCK